jgi:hypothetical protein
MQECINRKLGGRRKLSLPILVHLLVRGMFILLIVFFHICSVAESYQPWALWCQVEVPSK